ncbi:hypothetical protein [Paracoccus aestuariivivens]|uniref:Uncharacterized protein n=1 Tax=Paracoccus aestuariivivens TaxID=1820333 RepID=A0A6L6JBH8_9RHOB|nr:hypothetical protein [Paracoccus aestuariivivens]MTH79340.1 hypothetical protein [Paracoccus aestuariivivens]
MTKNVTMIAPTAATPVTIMMNTDAFYPWLAEVQGEINTETGICDQPDFCIEDIDEPDAIYSKVEVYLTTSEGRVMACHLYGENLVKVTIRSETPGANFMRTVREMIEEARTDVDELNRKLRAKAAA